MEYDFWLPDPNRLSRPIYLSIVNLIEEDIQNGILKAGDKLPPQRLLAEYLGVNFTTISRAYKQCEARNLIYGVEGSGTFVSPQAYSPMPNSMDVMQMHRREGYDGKVIMGFISDFGLSSAPILKTLDDIVHSPAASQLLTYTHPLGFPEQKETGAQWLKQFGVQTDPGSIVVTTGTMNALTACLISLFQPGDRIAVDYYIFFNFIHLAKRLQLQLIPVECDEQGMLPDALAGACRINQVKGVFLMPSCANPTTVFMPFSRKYELSQVIQNHQLIVLEDEYFAFATSGYVSEYVAPLRELLPDQTIYLSSTSYALYAGLRAGFMVLPAQYHKAVTNTICNMNVKNPSFDAAIVCNLIQSGKAEQIIKEKLNLSTQASQLFSKYFPSCISGHPYSFFRWLRIPEKHQKNPRIGWQALSLGVHCYHSRRFTCSKEKTERYLRISLSSEESLNNVEQGLLILHNLLNE